MMLPLPTPSMFQPLPSWIHLWHGQRYTFVNLHLHLFLASCACNWSLAVSFQGFPEFQSFKSSSWLQRKQEKKLFEWKMKTPSSFGCHVREPAPVLRSCDITTKSTLAECTSVCRVKITGLAGSPSPPSGLWSRTFAILHSNHLYILRCYYVCYDHASFVEEFIVLMLLVTMFFQFDFNTKRLNLLK